MEPVLDRLYLFAEVADDSYFPDEFYQCIGAEVPSGEDGEWSAYVELSDPEGAARLFAHECPEADDHTHHVTADLRLGWHLKPSRQAGHCSWERLVDCFRDVPRRVGKVWVTAFLEYDASSYSSPLAGFSSLPSAMQDSSVEVTGIELNFSRSKAPLRRLRVSHEDDMIRVTVGFRRALPSEGPALAFIRDEAVRVASLFISPSAMSGIEQEDLLDS